MLENTKGHLLLLSTSWEVDIGSRADVTKLPLENVMWYDWLFGDRISQVSIVKTTAERVSIEVH